MKNCQKTGFPIEFWGFDATDRKLSMRSRIWDRLEGPDPSKTRSYKGFKSKVSKFSIFGPPLSFLSFLSFLKARCGLPVVTSCNRFYSSAPDVVPSLCSF